MASAWDIPANPLTDEELGTSAEADLVRRGYRLFTDTPSEAPRLTHNRLSCNNCHLNAGQRELSLPRSTSPRSSRRSLGRCTPSRIRTTGRSRCRPTRSTTGAERVGTPSGCRSRTDGLLLAHGQVDEPEIALLDANIARMPLDRLPQAVFADGARVVDRSRKKIQSTALRRYAQSRKPMRYTRLDAKSCGAKLLRRRASASAGERITGASGQRPLREHQHGDPMLSGRRHGSASSARHSRRRP